MKTELELFENKINKINIINRIRIKKNNQKGLGDIEAELRKLEIKIKKELELK